MHADRQTTSVAVVCLALSGAALGGNCPRPLFAPDVLYAAGDFPRSVAIGKLNGDAFADLVVANENDGTVSVFINNGDGTFADDVVYPVGAGAQAVTIGDFDNDGDADIVTANTGSGTVFVLLNQGNGTFAAAAPYAAGITLLRGRRSPQ